MVPRLKTVLCLLCLSALLISCAKAPPPPILLTKTEVERVPLPVEKLRCPEDKPFPPAKPAAGTTFASYVAAFMARLDHWGDGCAARFDELRQLQERPIGAPAVPMTPIE